MSINTELDLVFERITHLQPGQLWEAWTVPAKLKQWLCPLPWKATDCRVELRPGGEFFSVMEGPEGERMENHGCFLEVVKDKKLVWTNLLTKDFRPAANNQLGFPFVVTLTFSQLKDKTLYRAVVAHADEDGRKKHEQMGFQEGWGVAFKQLEDVYRK